MSLKQYHQKRQFEQTPEPRGQPPLTSPVPRGEGATLRFVVQKHEARRLHFDFRLELDGVLKSWAVPKGPTLAPEEKRLAVMVEDHPLEYATFEGIIPHGSYGAGTVMVWDEGTYEAPDTHARAEAEAAIRHGFDKGHISFVLHGKKLQGAFTLIRTKRGKGNEWLLMKKRDQYASTDPIPGEERSVVSHRTLSEIASGVASEADVWDSKQKPVARERKRDDMPRKLKPMLAMPVDQPFDRPGWLFEVKWDGYRGIAEIEHGKVNLYSRAGLSFNDRYEPIVRSLEKLAHDAVLDGEIVVVDAEGHPNFQMLQIYQKEKKGQLVYYVFDLLYLDGQDLRSLPLWRRKELLRPLLRGSTNVLISDDVADKGTAFFKEVAKRGLEGIVGKRAASTYKSGRRTPDWIKVKTRQRQEAVIAGFNAPQGGRTDFGSVVLGVYDGDDLVYIGNAGSGFTEKSLADVHARLKPLVQKACPFKKRPKLDKPATWVEPRLVCEVSFAHWTDDGHIRFPVFEGLREDKDPKSVHREKPVSLAEVIQSPVAATANDRHRAATVREREAGTPSAPSGSRLSETAPLRSRLGKKDVAPFTFTNLDKIYFPEDGYTKGDIIAYYREIAPFILPHLHDRPESLHRHPDGIHAESFFQKDHTNRPAPSWVQTASVASGHRGRDIRYIVCQDEATLAYLANLGCIELNPWNSRVAALDYPDYVVIDLDPQDTPFTQVVETAQMVRDVLEKSGAKCCCKTSGKRGLHIYVPLAARYHYDLAKQFAELVARLVQQRLPEFTSVTRDPKQRRRLVYVDFLQNRRSQTIAAPYCVRPVVGATVSTPLSWKEVSSKLDPKKFTIQTVPRRLEKVGDLWQAVLGPGADLVKCLEKIQALQARIQNDDARRTPKISGA